MPTNYTEALKSIFSNPKFWGPALAATIGTGATGYLLANKAKRINESPTQRRKRILRSILYPATTIGAGSLALALGLAAHKSGPHLFENPVADAIRKSSIIKGVVGVDPDTGEQDYSPGLSRLGGGVVSGGATAYAINKRINEYNRTFSTRVTAAKENLLHGIKTLDPRDPLQKNLRHILTRKYLSEKKPHFADRGIPIPAKYKNNPILKILGKIPVLKTMVPLGVGVSGGSATGQVNDALSGVSYDYHNVALPKGLTEALTENPVANLSVKK